MHSERERVSRYIATCVVTAMMIRRKLVRGFYVFAMLAGRSIHCFIGDVLSTGGADVLKRICSSWYIGCFSTLSEESRDGLRSFEAPDLREWRERVPDLDIRAIAAITRDEVAVARSRNKVTLPNESRNLMRYHMERRNANDLKKVR